MTLLSAVSLGVAIAALIISLLALYLIHQARR